MYADFWLSLQAKNDKILFNQINNLINHGYLSTENPNDPKNPDHRNSSKQHCKKIHNSAELESVDVSAQSNTNIRVAEVENGIS